MPKPDALDRPPSRAVPGRPLICRRLCGEPALDDVMRLCARHLTAYPKLPVLEPARAPEVSKDGRRAGGEPRPPRWLPVEPLIEKLKSARRDLGEDAKGTLQWLLAKAKRSTRIGAGTADRICVEVLKVHPTAVYGDTWWDWILMPEQEEGSNAA